MSAWVVALAVVVNAALAYLALRHYRRLCAEDEPQAPAPAPAPPVARPPATTNTTEKL